MDLHHILRRLRRYSSLSCSIVHEIGRQCLHEQTKRAD